MDQKIFQFGKQRLLTHEEADNRLLLHIRDMLLNDSIQKIIVCSVDTDVLVILLASTI